MKLTTNIPRILAATVIFAGLTIPAIAQDEDPVFDLNPFEVNTAGDSDYVATQSMGATRIAAPIYKLPVSIGVVTSELIDDMGALAIEDTIKYAGGISLGGQRVTSAPSGLSYTVRGFSTGLVLRNGNSASYQHGDIAFVDRVEVIKGPTALYGESTPGGFLNVLTKRPVDDVFTKANVEIGQHSLFRATLDTNQVWGKDNMFKLRFNAFHQQNDFKEANKNVDKWGFNPVLSIQVAPKTRLTFEVSYIDFSGISTRNPFPFIRPDGPFIEIDRRFTLTNASDYHNRTQKYYEVDLQHSFTDDLFLRVTASRGETEDNLLSTFNGAFATEQPDGSYSVPRWPGTDERDYTSDTISANLYWKTETDNFLNELILSGRMSREDGYYFIRIFFDTAQVAEDFPDFEPTKNLSDLNGDLFNISRSQVHTYQSQPNIANITYENQWIKNYGVTDRISLLNERLILLGSLRMVEVGGDFEPVYQAGVNYELTEGVSLFAGYNEAVQINGFRPDGSERWPPISAEAYEAGLKFNLVDKKLSGSLAVFDIAKTNIVNQGIFGGDSNQTGGQTESTLSGENKSTGLELSFYYNPIPNWQVVFAYTHLDARVTEEDAVVEDSEGNPVLEDRSGRRLMGAVDDAVAIWTKYTVTDGQLAGLSIGGGISWKAGPMLVFPDYNRRNLGQMDDFYEIDAFASYATEINDIPTVFSVRVINLTDETYLQSRGQLNAARAIRFDVGFEF